MKLKVYSLFFVIFLMLGCLLFIFLPKNVFSDDERRYLADFPALHWNSIVSGEWMESFETYVDDHFLLRLSWIEWSTKIRLAFGLKESNGVHLTDAGYYMKSVKSLDEQQFFKNIEYVEQFAERHSDITVSLMLVPTASGVLTQYLPKHHLEMDQIEYIHQLKSSSLSLIEVGPALKIHQDEPIYYRTDHHWTSLGAYYAYKQWKPDTAQLSEYKKEVLTTAFLGTLYAKVKVEPEEKDVMEAYYLSDNQKVEYNMDGIVYNSFYVKKFTQSNDPYSVYFNGNQPVTKIQGYGKGKLLIIKDSFANTFAQFAVSDYEEVHLIDLRSFKMPIEDYMTTHAIEEVLILYNLKNFAETRDLYLLAKLN